MKKLISLVLALALVFAVAVASAAADNGSITVDNAEIGKKYELYRLFDATVGANGGTAYTLPEGKSADSGFANYFKLENGYVIPLSTFTESVAGSTAFQEWAQGFGTKVKEETASTSTVAFTGLTYGYYFVKSEVGAVLTIDSANPSEHVIDKNQTNDSDKKIIEGSNKVVLNEAGINENVTFELTETVKNYDKAEKIYRYQIEDKLDPAFSYNTDSVVVKINNTELNAYDATSNPNGYKITFSVDSTTREPSFVMLIPWTNNDAYNGDHLYDNNSTIVITYTAKFDPAKLATNPGDLNVGATPNKNIAQLKWFKGSENPATPNGELEEDRTDTYDTALTIIKHDQAGNVLTGAQFTLTSTNGTKVVIVTDNEYVAADDGTHWKLKDGTYTTQDPNGTIGGQPVDTSVYDSTTQKYKLTTTQKVMGEGQTDTSIASYVGADGTVTFTGLAVGDYKIEETVVPAGYNKAADIEFSISFDPTTKKFASSNSAVVLNETNNVFSTTVVNNQGTELPSTGGIGTTIFYIVGGLLLVGAAVILVARKKAQD